MEHRFPYATKRGIALIGILLSLAVIAYATYSLATGGVITRRRGREDLSPEFSQAVFLVLILLAVGVIIWAVRKLLAGPLAVVLTIEYLEVPVSTTSAETVRIPLEEIVDLVELNSSAQGRTLSITSEGRKPVLLQATAFESPQMFSTLHQAIRDARHLIQG